MKEYSAIIKYVAKWYVLGRRDEDIKDSELVTLIAVIYDKDELRVVHDIKKEIKR